MTLRLNPEPDTFFDGPAASGDHRTAGDDLADVLDAAFARLLLDPLTTALDDATLAAIDRTTADLDPAHDHTLADVAADLRARLTGH